MMLDVGPMAPRGKRAFSSCCGADALTRLFWTHTRHVVQSHSIWKLGAIKCRALAERMCSDLRVFRAKCISSRRPCSDNHVDPAFCGAFRGQLTNYKCCPGLCGSSFLCTRDHLLQAPALMICSYNDEDSPTQTSKGQFVALPPATGVVSQHALPMFGLNIPPPL